MPSLAAALILANLLISAGAAVMSFPPTAASLRQRIGQRVTHMQNPCFVGQEYNATVICIPSLWIAGIGKSGTSALYHFLRFHSQISAPIAKELCPKQNEDDLAFLYRITHAQPRPLRPNQFIVNGCIRSYDPQMRRIADAFPEMKILYMFRQYPTWLYSTFWFWCYPGFDYNCSALSGDWVQPYHYRSAQLFHDLVLARDSYPREWSAGVTEWGKSRMLALTTESLHMRGEDVVKKVFGWIGVQVPRKLIWLAFNQTINANQKKGARAVSPRDAVLGGSYPPMLPETLEHLQRGWHAECKVMNDIAELDWECYLPPNRTDPPAKEESAGWGVFSFVPLSVSILLVVLLILAFRFRSRLKGRLRGNRDHNSPLPLLSSPKM